MEVVRGREWRIDAKLGETPGADTDHSVVLLQHAFDEQQGRTMEQRPIAMEKVGSDYRVGEPGERCARSCSPGVRSRTPDVQRFRTGAAPTWREGCVAL